MSGIMALPSEFLRHLMREHRIRVKDLVVRTGLGRATVNRHKSGDIEPSVDQREKYAAAFGMSLAAFETGWKDFVSPKPKNNPRQIVTKKRKRIKVFLQADTPGES